MRRILAFAIPAFVLGLVIVFVIPWAQGQLQRFPGIAKIIGNRVGQLFVVGTVGLLSLALFGGLSKKAKVRV